MDIASCKRIDGGVCAPQGFSSNAVCCGIKNPIATRLDLGLIYSEAPCVSAGMFTTNRVKAACVKVTSGHLQLGNIRAIVANSGNANACTGKAGIEVARKECQIVADQLGLKPEEVGVCSTGVIGLPMPMMRVEPSLSTISQGLGHSVEKGLDFANAIITSDTRNKIVAIETTIGGRAVRIGACCKGAGMISPCMATMLCFVTTDAGMDRETLEACTKSAVGETFNCITIDGDMSTNDTVLVLANGASGVRVTTEEEKAEFQEALTAVLLELAKMVVRDGERVTKFVTVRVKGARSNEEARKVADAVCKSFLVKSSWNGNDPNWGRIVHAIGYSQARVEEELIDVDIAGLPACRGGMQTDTPSDDLRTAVSVPEFAIDINLNLGTGTSTVYTSDISPEYVDFNRSEYAYWNQAKADALTK